MIVVSDTTAISSLYRIGKLDLLQLLFHEIILPNAVFEELTALETFGYDIAVIKNADWIQVKHATNQALIFKLSEILDLGESEAIALAQEIGADLLLIDEKRGRLKANELGIATVGLIGIITRLKKAGHIEAIKPILDELRSSGFWIQESFYQKIVASEGE
ncbi:MAG: DUF3368 domain-containing protein [Saprospiraceae bacterium]|nr:DUF3368 domain-containing protein [Saprospiraceae bacterium]